MHDVGIYRSPRKHGLDDADLRHAVRHAIVDRDIEDSGAPPWRVLSIGPDRAGNLLKVVVLERDEGSELAIHAMKLRPRYRHLLHRPADSR